MAHGLTCSPFPAPAASARIASREWDSLAVHVRAPAADKIDTAMRAAVRDVADVSLPVTMFSLDPLPRDWDHSSVQKEPTS
jgi:hypothetical protein